MNESPFWWNYVTYITCTALLLIYYGVNISNKYVNRLFTHSCHRKGIPLFPPNQNNMSKIIKNWKCVKIAGKYNEIWIYWCQGSLFRYVHEYCYKCSQILIINDFPNDKPWYHNINIFDIRIIFFRFFTSKIKLHYISLNSANYKYQTFLNISYIIIIHPISHKNMFINIIQ